MAKTTSASSAPAKKTRTVKTSAAEQAKGKAPDAVLPKVAAVKVAAVKAASVKAVVAEVAAVEGDNQSPSKTSIRKAKKAKKLATAAAAAAPVVESEKAPVVESVKVPAVESVKAPVVEAVKVPVVEKVAAEAAVVEDKPLSKAAAKKAARAKAAAQKAVADKTVADESAKAVEEPKKVVEEPKKVVEEPKKVVKETKAVKAKAQPAAPKAVVEEKKEELKPAKAAAVKAEASAAKAQKRKVDAVVDEVVRPAAKVSKAKKGGKPAAPAPVAVAPVEVEVVVADDEDLDEGVVDAEDDDVIRGLETASEGGSDDEDSSDDEENFKDVPIRAEKLPTIAKDDKTVRARLDRAAKKPTDKTGTVYVGRIPHGFYEDQMKSYFTQFGDITRLRISRNKKTGASKHYAFIEFASAAVADIVADTMDNYLLDGHILKCKIVPQDKVHESLWIGANRKYRAVPQDQITRGLHNENKSEEQKRAIANKIMKRQNAQRRKLASLGIDYEFEGYTPSKKMGE
uniref:RRM domain-containing protein n=1 Tax=Bartheletia paradoxa TaxID=669517 RepID=A0A2D0XHZ8_9BASI|nr:hypothetical protein SPAR06313 [Bartheletia paradoxa]